MFDNVAELNRQADAKFAEVTGLITRFKPSGTDRYTFMVDSEPFQAFYLRCCNPKSSIPLTEKGDSVTFTVKRYADTHKVVGAEAHSFKNAHLPDQG